MRRRLKVGAPLTRRMFCTGSMVLLNSPQGRVALNFKPTTRPPVYDPNIRNLLLVWDIFMQDYRMISMSACELITTVPIGSFWKFFNEYNLATMSPADKIAFMNK